MSKARKGLAILGLASAMAFAGPAFAQDTGFYAGISLSQSSADVDCTGTTSCDDEDSAWKILGGYRFSKHFAVEFGYTDLGEVTGTVGASNVAIESTAFELVAVGFLPFADKFSAYGKVGMYRGDTEATVTGPLGGSVSESNTGLTFAVGVQWDFTKNLAARAEWQKYSDVGGDNVGGEGDVDVIGIGVIWKF
jgi:OmpA-OmpF porin, OOP family